MRHAKLAAAMLLATAALVAACVTAPQGPTPASYLQTAAQDVRAHHARRALVALSRAEADYLDHLGPPARPEEPDLDPIAVAIASARDAVRAKDWTAAGQWINQAQQNPGIY